MQLPLYERVTLLKDVPETGFKKGDIVTTVEFIKGRRGLPDAYYVEAFNALGKTVATFIVEEDFLGALQESDVLSSRSKEPAQPLEQGEIVSFDQPSTISQAVTIPEKPLANELFELLCERFIREQLPENQARLDAAIWLFQHEVCSLGKASQLSGLSIHLFQKALAARSIPTSYGTEDFREDLSTLNQNNIFQKTS